MALTTAQREAAWSWFTLHRAPTGTDVAAHFTKDDLRTALDAATLWIENNQASFVTALATTAFAGANSTADEKIRLFVAALTARYGVTV